jgi:hypothetical protein
MSVAMREIGTGLDPRHGSFPCTRSPTAENNHCDEGRSEQAAAYNSPTQMDPLFWPNTFPSEAVISITISGSRGHRLHSRREL